MVVLYYLTKENNNRNFNSCLETSFDFHTPLPLFTVMRLLSVNVVITYLLKTQKMVPPTDEYKHKWSRVVCMVTFSFFKIS
jgi:hypothetical protein